MKRNNNSPLAQQIKVLAVVLLLTLSCKVQDSATNTALPIGPLIYETVDTSVQPDQMPEYPGGTIALNKHLKSNLKYPKDLVRNKISGKVFTSFIIKQDGSIVNIKVIRGVHEILDKEAIRVISLMPKWKPGYKDGKPIDVSFVIPVNYSIK